MSDRNFFGLIGAVTLLLLVLSLAWPQGIGRRSPPPFGHVTAAEVQARAAAAEKAKHPDGAKPKKKVLF